MTIKDIEKKDEKIVKGLYPTDENSSDSEIFRAYTQENAALDMAKIKNEMIKKMMCCANCVYRPTGQCCATIYYDAAYVCDQWRLQEDDPKIIPGSNL